MVRTSITINDITQVLVQYDQVKVWRADTQGGPYAEITISTTRIVLYPEYTRYNFDDPTGDSTKWYKSNYYNSTTFEESVLSSPLQGGTEVEKLGYSFNNYASPPGEWGKLVTADDIRSTYLFGIDCVGNDIAQTAWTDAQFDWTVELAMGEFEKYLGIDIRKKVYKTNPAGTLKRGVKWREGVDYTHEEDSYEFDPSHWDSFGFVSLRHSPIISVERAVFLGVLGNTLVDMKANNWLRLQKDVGQVYLYPRAGAYLPSPAMVYMRAWARQRYPNGYEFDYTTGFPSSDFVPEDIRDVVSKWAATKCLAMIGDGLLAGFSSSSVSLDGLSESFSSTQSATSAYFGARILQYQKEIKEWLQVNVRKHGSIPMSFTGA